MSPAFLPPYQLCQYVLCSRRRCSPGSGLATISWLSSYHLGLPHLLWHQYLGSRRSTPSSRYIYVSYKSSEGNMWIITICTVVLLLNTCITCMVCLFQQVTKRHLRRSKSLVSVMLWGGSEEFESDKAKNVRQTEILVDLREAILQVARHFQSIDPKNSRVVRTSVILIVWHCIAYIVLMCF